jgi:apolipoprotein N-acyltransferase
MTGSSALSAATGAAESKMREWKIGLAYALVMGVAGLVAVIYLLVALTLALTTRYGAIEASLGLAICFALVAIAAGFLRRRAVRKAHSRAKRDARQALMNGVAAGVASSPKTASLFALIAGYFLLRK